MATSILYAQMAFWSTYKGFLWKADYSGIYKSYYPDLKMVKEEMIPHITNIEQGNVDAIFLLEK